MRMVRPRVDLQLSELLATEPVARQHPLDRQPQHFLRAARDHLLERPRAQSARVAAVAVVALLLALVAGHRDLLGVDHDHEVADVAVRRVLRLALPAEHVGNLRREAAERLARRVDDEPIALAGCWSGYEGLHGRVAARTRLAGALPASAPAWYRTRNLDTGMPRATTWAGRCIAVGGRRAMGRNAHEDVWSRGI